MEIQTDLLPYLVNCFYTYFYLYFNNKEQISSMTSDHKSFIISTVGPVLVVVDIRLPSFLQRMLSYHGRKINQLLENEVSCNLELLEKFVLSN